MIWRIVRLPLPSNSFLEGEETCVAMSGSLQSFAAYDIRRYCREGVPMPILEYQCKECARQFEAIVLGAQQPMCPSCHSPKLERLLSVFAVGGKSDSFAASESFGPCGTCGDPRGPGACTMD